MKKRELIFLHGLLVEVKRELEDRRDVSQAPFEEYTQFGVSPRAINRSKSDHEAAIKLLREGLAETLASTPSADEGPQPPSTEA